MRVTTEVGSYGLSIPWKAFIETLVKNTGETKKKKVLSSYKCKVQELVEDARYDTSGKKLKYRLWKGLKSKN